MPTTFRLLGSLALALLSLACGDGDPLATDTASATSASGSMSGTGGETDGEPTGGGSSSDQELCRRFIQCISVTNPTALPPSQQGFGDDSDCWKGSEEDAALCGQACQTGLTQSHAAFPTEEKCYACLSDADCDASAGERCLIGGCTLTDCGDGIANTDEMCDGQPECSLDCQKGANCSPLSNLGCPGSDICDIDENDGESECNNWQQFSNVVIVGFSEGCGSINNDEMILKCKAGLACVPESLGNFNCDRDACCLPYCDVNDPNGCPMDYPCLPYAQIGKSPSEPALSYLGVCVP